MAWFQWVLYRPGVFGSCTPGNDGRPRTGRIVWGRGERPLLLDHGTPESFHGNRWSWSPSGEEIWFAASDTAEDRPLEAVTLSGRRRTLTRIPGDLMLYDESRDGLVLLEHAFSRIRVLARAPWEAAERELSVFDRTMLADLSADGRLAVLYREWRGPRATASSST